MKRTRQIIRIDEDKCDGCGQCVPACAEGALQIVNGKAKLISDVYCDGLGACLGHCPQGAITIEEREAEGFDEEAVKAHLLESSPDRLACGCPGSLSKTLRASDDACMSSIDVPSELSHWPVQIALVPMNAPYLREANLLVVADCVPFAYPSLHRDFLRGHAVLVGCPKLDDARAYEKKMEAIIKQARPASITIVHMEVPCCFGMKRLIETAVAASGARVPLKEVTIGIDGSQKAQSVLSASDM